MAQKGPVPNGVSRSSLGMEFSFSSTSSYLVHPVNPQFNLNPKKTATRRRDKTLRNRALSTYGKTFFPFTASDLVYPGNQPSNRLYLIAHIRINVPEDLRIKVNRLYQLAHNRIDVYEHLRIKVNPCGISPRWPYPASRPAPCLGAERSARP